MVSSEGLTLVVPCSMIVPPFSQVRLLTLNAYNPVYITACEVRGILRRQTLHLESWLELGAGQADPTYQERSKGCAERLHAHK